MTIGTTPKLINGPASWRLWRQAPHDEGAPGGARGASVLTARLLVKRSSANASVSSSVF